MNRIQIACYSLIASALVMLVVLVASLGTQSPKARADMVIAHNNYSMMTASTRANEESLFILDNINAKLLVYRTTLVGERGQVQLVGGVDLRQLFHTGGAGGGTGGGR